MTSKRNVLTNGGIKDIHMIDFKKEIETHIYTMRRKI